MYFLGSFAVGPMLELLFFAMLSAYIFYRLWSVLGQESEADEERREEKRKKLEAILEDNIIPMPQRKSAEPLIHVEETDLKSGVRDSLELLKKADQTFDFSKFIKGAKGAYEMVSKAFADGDLDTLKLLLSPKVYDAFFSEIAERQKRDETYEISIESFDRVDVDAIEIHGDDVYIAVRFRTHQILVTSDKNGNIIENQAKISIPVTEIWTFHRKISSSEPNWYLVKTQT